MRGFFIPRLLRQAEWRGRVALRSLSAVIQMRTFYPSPARVERGEGHFFIRLDGIGDFWLWLPFVAALKKAYPQQSFYLIANRLWAELAEITGLFSRILPIDPYRLRRSYSYRQTLTNELRRQLPPAEVLWQTTYSRRIAAEDFLAWVLPAEKKVAWERDPATAEPRYLSEWIDKSLYDSVFSGDSSPSIHEWLRYEQWLRSINGMSLGWKVYAQIRQNLPRLERGVVALAGSSVKYKLIPLQLYRQLLLSVYQHTKLPIRILGTATDKAYVENLALPFLEDLSGKLSLVEAVEEVASARLVVGPDTGLAHVAATLGVPTLMIAGGGHWGRFVPYPAGVPFPLKVLANEMSCFGCGWMCQYQWDRRRPYPCIARLSPEGLIEQALLWLDMQGFQQHAGALG